MTCTGTPDKRNVMRNALHAIGYEVMPFARTREAVVENVPRSIRITVTASPQRGIDATIDLASRLAADGYSVAPHLSARLIADEAHLTDILARLAELGISRLFVVGGDGEPTGKYSDALALLKSIRASRFNFADIGIGGYPEGHASISDAQLMAALQQKAALADHITTQICFDAAKAKAWAQKLADRDIRLPIMIGIPGAINRQKLLRITASIGVGDSARFLRKQSSLFWRFFMPSGYNPTRLVRGLQPSLAGDSTLSGFHIFTFNDVKGAEKWRQRSLRRLGEISSGGSRPCSTRMT